MSNRIHFCRVLDDEITVWHIFVKDNNIHNFIQTYKNNNRHTKYDSQLSLRCLIKEQYYKGTTFDYKNIETYIKLLVLMNRLNNFFPLTDTDAKTYVGHHNYANVVGCNRKGTLKYEILVDLLTQCKHIKYTLR